MIREEIGCQIAVRAMTPADVARGLQLCRASGWNQTADDWRVFLELPGSQSFVAEKNGEVVGTVATLDYQDSAWVAMMLVDSRERGSGVGSQLLQAGLAALAPRACIALDATPAGEPLYRRHGFASAGTVFRMRAIIESDRFPLRSDRVRRIDEADLRRIFELDRKLFGADRSGLLKLIFDRAPEYAWIAEEDGGLAGYCFGRPGHLYHQVGPIVTTREEIARELVSRCLSEHPGKSFAIDVPGQVPEWLSWLASGGFTEERRLVRMFRGEKMSLSTNLHYGIAGPELG